MSRVILIVMDSVGIGELPDAAAYGDEGSNTVANIARAIPLRVPALRSLGFANVVEIGAPAPPARGAFGRMAEASAGKVTASADHVVPGPGPPDSVRTVQPRAAIRGSFGPSYWKSSKRTPLGSGTAGPPRLGGAGSAAA